MREIRQYLFDLGITEFVTIETGGKHLRLVFRNGEKKSLVTVSKTPGDHRTWLNSISKIKKAARDVGCLNLETN